MNDKSKILIVTADLKLVGFLQKQLGKLHKLIHLAEGEILKKIFSEVPHLILIDEGFEGTRGGEAAELLKEDALLKFIPTVFLVAKTPSPDSEVPSPVNFYFEKGRDSGELLYLIERVLSQSYNEIDLNPLTRLPGIRSTVVRLEKAIASKKSFAVLSVDMSSLEVFNSVYGDARGDEVIIRLGEIVLDIVSQGAPGEIFLGHLGGDDFLVVADPKFAVSISKMVIRNFDEAIPNFYDAHDRQQGFVLSQNKEGVSTRYPVMSISIAVIENETYPIGDVADISRIAGIMQMKMKSLPGSCYMKNRQEYYDSVAAEEPQGVYAPGKYKDVKIYGLNEQEKIELFNEVVLRRKSISTVYQPIVDLKTLKVVGYEALTRGVPESPFQDPTLMFHMARESGMVRQLDRLCLDMALKNGQGLPADKKLNLNLNHETLIDQKSIKHLFSEKGAIGFKSIVIEITEESILGSFQKMRETLSELKDQGASVAIDDIGGGAVSLRDVAILKPDYLKFDRSLIRQIDKNTTKQRIVLSMLLFASGIGATTTAEGIETKEEYEAVLACGVHLGQGYYFARPAKQFITAIELTGS